ELATWERRLFALGFGHRIISLGCLSLLLVEEERSPAFVVTSGTFLSNGHGGLSRRFGGNSLVGCGRVSRFSAGCGNWVLSGGIGGFVLLRLFLDFLLAFELSFSL